MNAVCSQNNSEYFPIPFISTIVFFFFFKQNDHWINYVRIFFFKNTVEVAERAKGTRGLAKVRTSENSSKINVKRFLFFSFLIYWFVISYIYRYRARIDRDFFFTLSFSISWYLWHKQETLSDLIFSFPSLDEYKSPAKAREQTLVPLQLLTLKCETPKKLSGDLGDNSFHIPFTSPLHPTRLFVFFLRGFSSFLPFRRFYFPS